MVHRDRIDGGTADGMEAITLTCPCPQQRDKSMTKVEQLTQEMRQLSRAELMAFREWFRTYDAEAWDEQIEADVQSGKLDTLEVASLLG
jgi:hypothetical protein